MGNSICLCFQHNTNSSSVKLIFWEGDTKILNGSNHVAGEIMFESPDKMVCHADSFFIGHPIPALAIDDQLMPGQTYFVLPIDVIACKVLTASSLAKIVSSHNKRVASEAAAAPMNVGDQCRPFEYLKGENGRILIKVMPEFMIKLIDRGKENDSAGNENNINNNQNNDLLCSTPELKKHYDQLVGSREQVWSPKLETISEHNNIRFSPCTFIGLDWKQKGPKDAGIS